MTIIDRANQANPTIDIAHEVLAKKRRYSETEYETLIMALLWEVSQAYEDGCNVVTTNKDFTPEELDHERRSA